MKRYIREQRRIELKEQAIERAEAWTHNRHLWELDHPFLTDAINYSIVTIPWLVFAIWVIARVLMK